MQLKADRRTSAMRTASKLKADRRTISKSTTSKLKADRRPIASSAPANSKADYRGGADRATDGSDVGHISKLSSRTFGPNAVGGDCFFRFIENATGHIAHSQMAILPLR